MMRPPLESLWPSGLLISLAWVASATAQVSATSPQAGAPAASAETEVDGLYVTAHNGQTQAQQEQDQYECHNWATNQTGFDPSLPGGGVPESQNASRRSEYQRAMSACLEARGYAVRLAAAPVPVAPAPPFAPPPPPRPPFVYGPPVLEEQPPPVAKLTYHPFVGQIDGGYGIAAGSTSQNLHGGGDFGLGFAWIPTALLPLAVRVDGSYSWYGAKAGLLGSAESVYGADADLQLNLEHGAHARMYLFGGPGEYREHTDLRQVSFQSQTVCNPFGSFCGPGNVAIFTTDEHTTNWHFAWNAGLGWEIATGPFSTFFIEARYLQIGPNDSKQQFVPITVGFRF